NNTRQRRHSPDIRDSLGAGVRHKPDICQARQIKLPPLYPAIPLGAANFAADPSLTIPLTSRLSVPLGAAKQTLQHTVSWAVINALP
ncbi:hypothetical protein BaRGS_00000747, partial [Batillaria attramentaria]